MVTPPARPTLSRRLSALLPASHLSSKTLGVTVFVARMAMAATKFWSMESRFIMAANSGWRTPSIFALANHQRAKPLSHHRSQALRRQPPNLRPCPPLAQHRRPRACQALHRQPPNPRPCLPLAQHRRPRARQVHGQVRSPHLARQLRGKVRSHRLCCEPPRHPPLVLLRCRHRLLLPLLQPSSPCHPLEVTGRKSFTMILRRQINGETGSMVSPAMEMPADMVAVFTPIVELVPSN